MSDIATLVDTIVPTVTVRFSPNQKLWVDGSIRDACVASGDMDEYKASGEGCKEEVQRQSGVADGAA